MVRLWIAFRFCIFVLWTQFTAHPVTVHRCCELLSDFVYSFFEHNPRERRHPVPRVVNCFQILYIRSLNTIVPVALFIAAWLWIAFRFCIFVLWTQFSDNYQEKYSVVNCFQILYIRSLNTIDLIPWSAHFVLWIAFRFCIFVLWTQFAVNKFSCERCCELLSDFVYSFFEHNKGREALTVTQVVNCFQILYIRSLNTIHHERT